MKRKVNFQCIVFFLLAVLIITTISCSHSTVIKTESKNGKECYVKTTGLFKKLDRIPQIVSIKPISLDSSFKEGWEVFFKQPIDHEDREKGYFTQQVFIGHKNYNKPVVFVTAGYSVAKFGKRELADILDANQIIVEHRYFEDSQPEKMDWKYMNTEQAAADHHAILQTLKKIYQGKWVNTGISKGGTTTMLFKSYYPDDVDATVAYVAPLNYSQADPRINEFFTNVGTEEERRKLRDYQKNILMNKDELVPRFKWFCKGKGYEFSYGSYEVALEYAVLEFPYIYWQWGGIELDSANLYSTNPDSLLEPLTSSDAIKWYTDETLREPSMYQFATQLGYYGKLEEGLAYESLFSEEDYPYPFFAGDTTLIYNPEPMARLQKWLNKNGNNIIYINGGEDPWGATGVEISENVNAIKKVLSDGDHSTRIKDLNEADKEEVISTLKKWLELY